MREIVRVSVRNLSHQKTRTALTLLGVVIGIASVVALISLGQGLTASVQESLESLGPNRIFVTPIQSGGFGPPSSGIGLSDRDLEAIKKVRNVDIALPVFFTSLPVEFRGEKRQISITGIPVEDSKRFFSDVQTFEIESGRELEKGDTTSAMIGARVDDTFDEDIKVGDRIEILDKKFRIVGITKETGDAENDRAVMIPIDELRELSNAEDDDMTVILVKATSDPKRTAEEIEEELEDLHNEKLFSALTTEQLTNQINQVFGIIGIVLAGIAGISLLVASFGIMNTMLMAVIERTREIGIMKAIGATNRRILTMFLVESSIVGFIGGLAGVIIGYAMSFGLAGASFSFMGLNLSIALDPGLIISVLAFSTFIGALSGTYPAWRASKLDPVEALRYE